VDGLLIVDKPVGPTSHDVVARVRRVLGERRIGHTGTLDPAASGVLPLVVGRATRLAQFLSAADKVYEATVRLGVETNTYDSLGQTVGAPRTGPFPTRQAIDRALDEFRGTFLQQPPVYSAKKIGGKRSHRLARGGQARALLLHTLPAIHTLPAVQTPPALPAPALVTAHAIDIVGCEDDRVTIVVNCSAGFYLRSLAHDLGDRLGIGAHLEALRRTRSGDATIAAAVPLAIVEHDRGAAIAALVPLAHVLPALTSVILTDEGARRAGHGRDLGPSDFAGGTIAVPQPAEARVSGVPPRFRLLDRQGNLIGVAESARTPGLLHPAVILV
jgi:tRNA pseudouridine55 synthase